MKLPRYVSDALYIRGFVSMRAKTTKFYQVHFCISIRYCLLDYFVIHSTGLYISESHTFPSEIQTENQNMHLNNFATTDN